LGTVVSEQVNHFALIDSEGLRKVFPEELLNWNLSLFALRQSVPE